MLSWSGRCQRWSKSTICPSEQVQEEDCPDPDNSGDSIQVYVNTDVEVGVYKMECFRGRLAL